MGLSVNDAFRSILKDYPDVMNIEQMSEVLGISTKTGYKLLKEGTIMAMKVAYLSHPESPYSVLSSSSKFHKLNKFDIVDFFL